MISNDVKQKMMNGNIPFIIKLLTLDVGFILNGVAYITNPCFTNGASIAYADPDMFFESGDYKFIEVTDKAAIATAKIHEEFYQKSEIYSNEFIEKEKKELLELYTDSNIQIEKEELIKYMELKKN